MDFSALKKYRMHAIVIFLLLFMAVAFLLRILPALVTRDLAFFPVYDTDTWYNLRQIEVMVHNFPQYNWFDPMTAYPEGKLVDWGPLYPFLAAVLCLVTGAASQSAVISMAGFVSPLLAAGMVPLMYWLGKKLGDYRTGLVAGALITVTSLMYFSFSSYGMIDHHGAEVFFSTLLFVIYLYGLAYARQNPVDIRKSSSLPYFCLIAALAGIVYFLGLITSTTVILALLVIAVYTLVQGMEDFRAGKNSDYLCLQNIILLGVATILLFIFGFRTEGISFSQYSIGIVYLHGAVAAESILIRVLAEVFRTRRRGFFVSIAGLGIGTVILIQVVPVLQTIAQQAFSLLFGFSVYSVGVEETLPWSISGAFETVNVGIILAAGGFLVLGYYLRKSGRPELVFCAVWSFLMLLITIQHQRFLYYFTVNIVLLSALCITEPLRWKNNPISSRIFSSGSGEDPPEKTEQKRSGVQKSLKPKKAVSDRKEISAASYIAGFCIVTICLLTVIHLALSLQQDYTYGISARERVIPEDWLESLEWMKQNTPDPGIDYFGTYDAHGYSAPPASYGIMAVWDAGHWITFFAHRLPITNPFQDNLGGPRGTAAFFLAENESKANSILKLYQGRYVITDSTMAVDRFTNLVPWQSGSVDISRYIKWFLVPDAEDPRRLMKIHKYDNGYFQTMVARLHNFDGSMTMPSSAEYINYTIRLPGPGESAEATGYSRVITDEKTVNISGMDNPLPLSPEGAELLPTSYTALFSDRPDQPVQNVPAVQHYRLVHESAHDAPVTMFPESAAVTLPGIRMVKIFEYVKGARITGTGTIELPVVTNTGRTFTWRQESAGGEFIVPYSTAETTTGVHATGPYRITGTDRYYTVTEDDVISGKTVRSS